MNWDGGMKGLLQRILGDERGVNTTEMMSNAALAVAALVVIWGTLSALGIDIVAWVQGSLLD